MPSMCNIAISTRLCKAYALYEFYIISATNDADDANTVWVASGSIKAPQAFPSITPGIADRLGILASCIVSGLNGQRIDGGS